jgi:MFS family permease
MMIFMGGTPLGAPIIGWVGEVFGARWTLIGGGAVALLGTLVATAAFAWRHDLVVRAHFGRHPGLDVLTREQRTEDLGARSLVG